MLRRTQGIATIFFIILLQACSGSGGGGGSQQPPAQPPPSGANPQLLLTASNYQTVLKVSVGTSMTAFNYVKLSGDMAASLLNLPILLAQSIFPCPDGGLTWLDIDDRNADGFFNVGDYVNQAYDHCETDGSMIDGIIRIELKSVTPKDGGLQIEVFATIVGLTLKLPNPSIGQLTINFLGPVLYTSTPAYEQFQLAGASFSSGTTASADNATALYVDFTQNHASGDYQLMFGGSVDSAGLGGKFEYSTFTPFTGTIGQFPTRGRLLAAGRENSTARLSEEGAAANNDSAVFVAVDSNGDSVTDASVSEFAWGDIAPRQLFDAFNNQAVALPGTP